MINDIRCSVEFLKIDHEFNRLNLRNRSDRSPNSIESIIVYHRIWSNQSSNLIESIIDLIESNVEFNLIDLLHNTGKNFPIIKVSWFDHRLSGANIVPYFSCAFMNFHEKISNFQSSFFSQFRCEIQVFFMRFHEFSWKYIKLSKFILFPVQMWDSSIFHALSWIFTKKYQTFKVHFFPSLDVRFKYFSCAFMNFHEKISIFKSLHFSQFRCEIQVLFMRFHEFSWKNIKLSKFILFPVQMWDSNIFMRFHEFSRKNIKLSKFILFPV